MLTALAASTAACSSETNRFSDATFSNPFSTASRQPAPQPDPGYAPRSAPSQIQSQPLPPQGGYQQQSYNQSSAPLPPPPQQNQPYASAPQTRPAYANPRTASPGRAPNASFGDTTGSVPRTAPASSPGNGHWSWEGGTAITLAPGETIDTVSRRYGVPSSAIAQANGLAAGAKVYPGQRLVIPKYSFGNGQTAAAPGPGPRLAAAQPQASAPLTTGSVRAPAPQQYVHVINPGETLMALSRKYNKSLSEIARANNLPINHRVRLGERIVIPGLRGTGTQTAAAQPPAVAAPPVQRAPAQPQRMVAAEPQMQNSARVVTPAKDNPEQDKAAADEPTGATGFRWPVRGRVIAGFGPKPTGQQNDGINLAVPEGTPVKAADDGTVAYAGNELKGYGNLVLVRHANGFVTAYAHASELLVKRGDSVKRGQVIAKSGQTGNVTSPQLHFEVRKGATPVDPMQHLSGAS